MAIGSEKVVTITKFIGSESSDQIVTITSSSNTQLTIDSWSENLFRSAKYTIQITYGSSYEILEMKVLQNGLYVWMNQYGDINNNGSLGIWDANIQNSYVNILFTPNNAGTVIKFIKQLITV